MASQRVTIPPRAVVANIDSRHVSVFVKSAWEDALWFPTPYLEPISLNERSIGSDSTCQLRYRFGDIKREDRASFAFWALASTKDVYVAIRVVNVRLGEDYVLWVGVIPSEEIRWDGSQIIATAPNNPAGVQIFNAFGLEYLLDKRAMRNAPIMPPDQSASDNEYKIVNDVPSFNERPKIGSKLIGNRSDFLAVNTADSYPNNFFFVFSKDGATWRALDIMDLLLTYSDDFDFPNEPHFEITAPSLLLTFLSTWQLFHDHKQRTVLGSLRTILNPQNGLNAKIGWTVGPNGFPTTGKVYVECYTLIGADLTLSNRTLPRNANTATDSTLGFDFRNKAVTVSLDSKKRYDKIVVRGEKIRMCFSAAAALKPAPETSLAVVRNMAEFFPAWTIAEENEYNAIDTDATAQRLQKKWERVYQRFYLGNNASAAIPWDWKTKGSEPYFLHPDVLTSSLVTINNRNTDFGDITSRLLDRLPFANAAEVVAEAFVPGLEKPAAWVRAMDPPGAETSEPSTPETWFNVVDPPPPGMKSASTALTPSNDHTANLTMSDRALEFNVKFRKGAQVLALNRMLTTEVGASGQTPQYDYDFMVATLNVALDARLEAVHEPAPPSNQAFAHRVKIIQVSDAHFWIVAPTTIVGLQDDGTLKPYSGPQVVRDDMPRLLDRLVMAVAWYGVDRAIVTRKRAGIEGGLEIGTYLTAIVTELGRANVESVVSERNFGFEDATTTIKTNVYALNLTL